jgi:hypothetical protein
MTWLFRSPQQVNLGFAWHRLIAPIPVMDIERAAAIKNVGTSISHCMGGWKTELAGRVPLPMVLLPTLAAQSGASKVGHPALLARSSKIPEHAIQPNGCGAHLPIV